MAGKTLWCPTCDKYPDEFEGTEPFMVRRKWNGFSYEEVGEPTPVDSSIDDGDYTCGVCGDCLVPMEPEPQPVCEHTLAEFVPPGNQSGVHTIKCTKCGWIKESYDTSD